MSSSNKFLSGSDTSNITRESLQNGTTDINAKSLTADNLSPNLPLKTDANGIIYSTKLDVSDIIGLSDGEPFEQRLADAEAGIETNKQDNITQDQRLDAIEQEIGQPFPTSRIDALEQKTANLSNVSGQLLIQGSTKVSPGSGYFFEATSTGVPFTGLAQVSGQTLALQSNTLLLQGNNVNIDGTFSVNGVNLESSQQTQDNRLNDLESKNQSFTYYPDNKLSGVAIYPPNSNFPSGIITSTIDDQIEFINNDSVKLTNLLADETVTVRNGLLLGNSPNIYSLPIDNSTAQNGYVLKYNSNNNQLEFQPDNNTSFDQSLNTTDDVQFTNVNVVSESLYLQGTPSQNAQLIVLDNDKRGANFQNLNNGSRTQVSYPVNDINNNRVFINFSGTPNPLIANGGIIIKFGATTGNTGYTLFYNINNNTLNYTNLNGFTTSTGITNISAILTEYTGTRLRVLDPSNPDNELFGINITKTVTSSKIDIIGNGSIGDLRFDNLVIQEYENATSGSVTVDKIQTQLNTSNQELVTKAYVQNISSGISGGTITFVKMFDPLIAQIEPLYEDANIRFEWDEINLQPTFSYKAGGQADIGSINPYISYSTRYLNSNALGVSQVININGFELSLASLNPAVEKSLYFNGSETVDDDFSLEGPGVTLKSDFGLDDIITADYYQAEILGGYIQAPDPAKCTFKLQILTNTNII